MYFVNEEYYNRPMVFKLNNCVSGFLSNSETVHAFSMVIDSAFIYYSNDHLKYVYRYIVLII